MNPPGKLEQIFAIVLLFLSTGAFTNLFLDRTFDATKGLPFLQALWAFLYLIVFFLLYSEGGGLWALLKRGWPFLPLLLVIVLSVLWSDAKGLTARRSVALVLTTVAGLYVSMRFNFAEQMRLLMPIMKVCVVFSFIFGAFEIGHSVDNLPGAWYGVFIQRNELGMMMSLSTLIFVLWSRIDPEDRWSAYGWAFLSVVLVLLSRSVTGFFSLAAGMLTLLLLQQIRSHPKRRRFILRITVLAAAVGLYLVAANLSSVLTLFDRDSTLTGRTTIWGASIFLGLDHPWIGYGFNAFWLGEEGPSRLVRQVAAWDVPSAHNGFLEIWLDLGFLGLLVFFVGLVRFAWKATQCFLHTYRWENTWPILFLAFLVVVNLVQSALISTNFIFWILYVAVSVRVCFSNHVGREGAARRKETSADLARE
jgi:exopolysaccharide production protein ExoQ